MSDFGFGALLRVAMRQYDDLCRQSGRTTSLLRAAKDGDLIVMLTDRDVDWMRRAVLDAGRQVSVVTLSKAYDLMRGERPASPIGQVYLDDRVVERFYKTALDRAAQDVAQFTGIRPDADDPRAPAGGVRALEIAEWRDSKPGDRRSQ